MTLGNLKAICASYLEVATSDFTVNGVDLFLVAANNVRKNAELRHNFEYCKALATLSIDGQTGAAIADAVILDNTASTISANMAGSGTVTPDVTGVFYRAGTADVFTNTTGDPAVLYYDSGIWKVDIFGTLQWTGPSVSTSPVGTYTPIAASGTLSIAEEGTSDVAIFTGIKEIVAVSRVNTDGTRFPLDFARSDLPIERDRSELEVSSDYWWDNRYLSDQQLLARRSVASSGSIIQRRNRLYVYPRVSATTAGTSDISVEMEVFAWLRNYVAADLADTDPTDFFLEHGHQFMQWATICELNVLFREFVPRQEGNLDAPKKEMASAWNDLLLWDSYMVDNNTTRSR